MISAFVFDLFAIDLSNFNVRNRPITQEHLNQRIQSLNGFERYWFEVLETSKFRVKSEFGLTAETEWEASTFISTQTIMDGYSLYDKNASKYEPLQTQQISATLKKICPSAKSRRTVNKSSKQERGYDLPPILVARREFEGVIKMPVNWNGEIKIIGGLYEEDEIDHDLLRDALREFATDAIECQS